MLGLSILFNEPSPRPASATTGTFLRAQEAPPDAMAAAPRGVEVPPVPRRPTSMSCRLEGGLSLEPRNICQQLCTIIKARLLQAHEDVQVGARPLWGFVVVGKKIQLSRP